MGVMLDPKANPYPTEEEIARGAVHGTGLKSTVMWDPQSQGKFANNEPARPRSDGQRIDVDGPARQAPVLLLALPGGWRQEAA